MRVRSTQRNRGAYCLRVSPSSSLKIHTADLTDRPEAPQQSLFLEPAEQRPDLAS